MTKNYSHRVTHPLHSFIACLGFLLSSQVHAVEPTQGGIVYSEPNFGGASWAVAEGTYDMNDLIAGGIGNDNVSSVKVAPGYQIQLCAHGPTDCVSHPASAASLGSGNNSTSSLIVSKSASTSIMTAIDALAKHVKGDTNLSEQALYDLRDNIINDAGYSDAASDLPLVVQGYQTIQSYESVHGPLFTDAGTKSFRKDDSLTDGHALARIMHVVYQLVFDGVNVANLAANPGLVGAIVFKSHEYFPGAVPRASNPNAVYQMRIDASVPEDWGRPNLYSKLPARRPTGAYVAPGTVAEVIVPPHLVNQGYKIRVGAHSYDLTGKGTQRRVGRVSNTFPISSTSTKVANPFGGNLYIDVPYLADDGIVTVQIKNTIRAPFYSARSFDKTTAAQWEVEKTHPGIFADIESERSMISLPSKWVRGDWDVVTVLQNNDDMADAMSTFMGRPEVRNKPLNFSQVDVDFRGNAFFPGYPMSNFPNFDDAEAPSQFQPSTFPHETAMHEMTHATLALFFRNESESIVHLPYILLLNKEYGTSLQLAFAGSVHQPQGDDVTLTDAFNTWALTDNFLAGVEANGWQYHYNYRGYGNYMDIIELFGWDALITLNRDINQHWVDFGDAIPRQFYEQGTDDRLLRLSRAAGADIRPIFHLWGRAPDNPQALASDLQAEGLKPSAKIYDRLLQHRASLPKTQAQFQDFWSRIGRDVWTETVWAPMIDNFDPARAQAAARQIDQLVALYFPNGRPATTDVVTVYQDHDFTGIRVDLEPGTYGFAALESMGIGNDRISSIQVKDGYSVFACAHSTNESCRTISASTTSLGVLNNTISFIEVRKSTVTEPTVTIYGDNHFGGVNVDLPVGVYKASELEAMRIGNDAISSIEVHDGYTVYACQHTARDGTCRSFSDSAATLGLLNNQISYIEVNRSTISEPTVTVYGNDNYSGTNVDLAVGAYNLSDLESLGIGNDTVSSIRLHNGYSAYACQHGVGGGVCRRYTESTPALGLLNNAISYIEVTRPAASVHGSNNYTGTSAGLPVGVYGLDALKSLGIQNDTISSIQVQDGYAVYACEDGGGNGRCADYVNSTPSLGVMNDTISYIEVVEYLPIARAQIDTDADGIPDVTELAENTDPIDASSLRDSNSDGIADFIDADSDNDGIWNENEHGGLAYYDRDRDGVPAYLDDNDYNEAKGNDDNAVELLFDPDRNGIASFQEVPVSTVDFDADQVPDHIEAIEGTDPADANSFSDFDQDKVPDYIDTDDDNDGIPDNIEGGADADGDNIPNYLDTDSDGDGTSDLLEGMTDVDGNLIPNFLDDATQHTVPSNDQDNDGIADEVEGAWDADLDGIANMRDTDSDNDAIPDSIETNADLDADGIPNFLDTDADGDSITDLIEGDEDVDGDSLGNFMDQDSDADAIPDSVETDADLDGNGVADFIDNDELGLTTSSESQTDSPTEPQVRTGTGSLDPLLVLLMLAVMRGLLRVRRRVSP